MERRRLFKSVRFALAGIEFALRTQRNLRWHVVSACGTLVAAVWMGVSRTEMAVLVLVIGMVLCAEILNTAVELTIDMIKITEHPVARIVKDVAAGAVLVTAIMALVIGWLILVPHLVG